MKIIKNSQTFNVVPSEISFPDDLWYLGTKEFWNEFISERESDCKIMQQFLNKNHSYLDIGAWIGSTSLFGSTLAKHCYAFEPDPVAYNKALENLKANPEINNINLYNMAINNKTGKIKFGTNSKRGNSMSSTLWTNDFWEADAISLEDFFEKENIKDCNFIKMDIEGGEFAALPPAKNLLKTISPTLFLSLHTPWFNDKKLFLETIIDSLSFYKNIYSLDGKLLTYNDILNITGFDAIIATNK